MAIVRLLQATDMSALPTDASAGAAVIGRLPTPELVQNDYDLGRLHGAVLWLLGSGFQADAFNNMTAFGTVTSVGIDISDYDVVPNLQIDGLSVAVTSSIADAVSADNFVLVAQLLLSGNDTFTGSADADYLIGFAGNDIVNGAGGADTIDGRQGNDVLHGGPGNDVLGGIGGRDTLIGDAGADDLFPYSPVFGQDNARDTIRFLHLSDSGTMATTRDEIVGFIKGSGATADRIDVSPIDANPSLAGNQAFKFVSSFTAAKGEVRLVASGGNTIIQVDGDNDLAVDMTILVYNVVGMHAFDFIL